MSQDCCPDARYRRRRLRGAGTASVVFSTTGWVVATVAGVVDTIVVVVVVRN